tara:strand:- start:85 stop:375 length:291 start_codon:yes stop_codon:yes gene_type:complete
MPIFDFECKKCGKVTEEFGQWSKDMHKHIDKCECGAKDFKRIHNVSWGYKRDLSAGHEERREADKLINKSHSMPNMPAVSPVMSGPGPSLNPNKKK